MTHPYPIPTETLSITYQTIPNDLLTPDDLDLCDAASTAALRAYAPYSHFLVGAAVRLSNGRLIDGNNQENAAYPSGICAERNTLFAALGAFPDASILALALAAHNDGAPVPYISPCGACRQVMMEAESRQSFPIRILLHGATHTILLPSVHALLPLWTPPKSTSPLS